MVKIKRPTLEEYIAIVVLLKKPDLIALANKYNLAYSIPHPSTLKKDELLNFILRHIKRVYKLYYSNKSDEELRKDANLPPKKKRTLKERDQEKLNKEIKLLQDELKPYQENWMKSNIKDEAEDPINKIHRTNILKKLYRLYKYVKVEPKQPEPESEDEEPERTPTQIKHRIIMDIDTLKRKIKNSKIEDKKKEYEKELKEKEKILKSL